MRAAPGNKENAMTVTLSKRLFEDSSIGSGCLSSPQASKKLRGLTPLADHLLTSCHSRPAAAGLGSLQQLHHSSARKRRHDTGTDSTNGAASPSTGIKRGKRADGRSSTAAASPNTAKSALEALLTYEGLEKDHDLAAEVAYITARQSAAGTSGNNNTAAAGPSSAGARASSPTQQERAAATATPAAGTSAARVQDAARSSREKRRDQDQNPRARRASAGSSGGGSSRDQVASLPTSLEAPQPAAAAAAVEQPDSPRAVTLELHADKEWQRMFAVLTISDSASSRRSNSSNRTTAAAAEGRMGAASHRLADVLDGAPSTPSAGAAATGPLLQEAPSTPARMEGGTSASQGADVTPRRSSFLAGEFSRVQQLRSTPPRAADAEARSVRLHTFCPAPAHPVAFDCDMSM